MSSSFEFETLILRFRDLVTGLGETIQNHQEIINKFTGDEAFVWWGWWNKDGEKLPANEFTYICRLALKGDFFLYLIDSGRKKAYKANCIDIQWDKIVNKIPSPDAQHTPEYYNSQKYYAWFKFLSIEEIELQELSDLTYICVDNFFEDSPSKFTRFYNKKIYDIEELIQQNRTIWFVRKYKEGDPKHQVILLNTDHFSPKHFSTDYFPVQSNQILWLSDTHFPDKTFPEKSNDTRKSLWGNINKILESDSKEIGIAGLLISGDITTQGEPEGYNMANIFLKEMNSSLTMPLESRNIIFCPGNHDFKFSTENVEIRRVDEDSAKSYKEFYNQVHFIPPNEYYSCGRKLHMKNGTLIDVVSLNSLLFQQFDKFQGQGFIGEKQLDNAAIEMGWKSGQPNKAIRIAMMHHHYLPTCLQDNMEIKNPSSAVFDCERLARWLTDYKVKILLHGHKHNQFFSKISRPMDVGGSVLKDEDMFEFYVFGLGSTGVALKDKGDQPNTFALLEFEIDKLNVIYYNINPEGSAGRVKQITIKI